MHRLNRKPHPIGFYLTLTTALFTSGCIFKDLSVAERVQSRGWYDVREEDSDSEPPLYCYRTIGAIDCFKDPIPARANQLVTVYPVKPRPKSVQPWFNSRGKCSYETAEDRAKKAADPDKPLIEDIDDAFEKSKRQGPANTNRPPLTRDFGAPLELHEQILSD